MNAQQPITYKELIKRVPLDKIKSIVGKFKEQDMTSFYTSDAIREHVGKFISNKNTAAALSFNANFGKILKSYARYFGIEELQSEVSIRDDEGHHTQASEWKIL